ncbi:MAG: hypothetical protein K2O45_18610, partial [Oscillospiraceae bacterium]|nr:hypothetical protein [Oscillospiraceae bacterium]
FEIDHEILPKVLLCVHPFLTTNDFVVEIYRESTQTSWQTTTQNMISELVFTPKMFLTLSNSDSIMETYTITFKALTDNTNYSFTLGTLDTFAEDFGGSDVIATVPSNAPDEKLESIGMTKYFSGYQALLNTGEWFHYRADGETYITARIAKRNSLAFIVINADTGEIEYESQDTDRRILNVSDTEWHGCVQKRLDLEPGGNYLIGFYSTEYIPTDDVMNDNYYIWIGYPYFTNEKISYASASYSVSAGTKRTFTFTLSGFTKSARANNMTRFYATGGKKSMDPRIKSCQITAPNGQTFQAQLGYYGSLPAAVFFNYLNNPSNIPLNGTWKVTVEAADDIPDFNFRISGHVLTIVGNDGN